MCRRIELLLPTLAAMIVAMSASGWAQSQSRPSVAAIKQMRDWKDVSGKHTIRAQFLGVIDRSKVALKTDEGKEMTIELSRLSNADIYEAVRSDLMTKLASTSPLVKSAPRKRLPAPLKPQASLDKAQAASGKAQPSGRRARGASGKAKPSPRKAQTSSAIPVSKPKPKVDADLVARIEEFIETIETEDTETIFQTILHPSEYAEFSKSPNFEAGLEKFEKDKKDRLLNALETINYDSVERKPGGKYQFQTESSPISFKNYKGSWYLKN